VDYSFNTDIQSSALDEMIDFGLQPEGIDIFDALPGKGAGVYEFWRNFNMGKYMRMQGLFRRIFSDWARFPGMNANFWSEQYSYDENGNRVEKTNGWGRIDYTYNAENQLLQAGNRHYQYDANGNLNRESLDNDITRYRHTAENRIDEIEYSQGDFEGTLYYQYDALQRQNTRLYIPSINNHELYAMEEHYSYLGQGFNKHAVYARELDEDTRQSNGELQKAIRNNLGMTGSVTAAQLPGVRNHRWADGQIQTYQHVYNGRTPVLSFGGYYTQVPAQFADTQKGHLSTTSRAYFVHDYQGSVRGVSAAYGNELMRIDYDAFGQTINGYVQNFGYTGKPIDGQSKQYNYGYRHYDPRQARFTTVDPIKDGVNWYGYVGNDPVNFVDPLGLSEVYASDVQGSAIIAYPGRDLKGEANIVIHRDSSDGYYNDVLDVNIGNQTVSQTSTQSEADWPGYEDDTIPEGEYVGTLVDFTGSYDNPISLENEDLGVAADDYTLIHPNQYTNQTKIEAKEAAGESTGPWAQPYSQNCQITESLGAYNSIQSELDGLGYEFTGYIGADGEYYETEDTISVTIQEKEGY
jgi:RHS repeat-associated protein